MVEERLVKVLEKRFESLASAIPRCYFYGFCLSRCVLRFSVFGLFLEKQAENAIPFSLCSNNVLLLFC